MYRLYLFIYIYIYICAGIDDLFKFLLYRPIDASYHFVFVNVIVFFIHVCVFV